MEGTRYGTMKCPEPDLGDEPDRTCDELSEVVKLPDRLYRAECPKGHVHLFTYRTLGAVEPL